MFVNYLYYIVSLFGEEAGENGASVGVVMSLRTFDRETCKEFHLPVIMKDGGHPPLSGTNTLTITIGDMNDNRHYAGQKNVIFFNYKGLPTLRLSFKVVGSENIRNV